MKLLTPDGFYVIAQANAAAQPLSDFWQKALVAAIGAAVGGAIGLLTGVYLDRRKAKREPLEQISYEKNIRSWKNLVPSLPEISKKLSVNYNTVSIENLYVVSCIIENTGNKPIRDQSVKFTFPSDTVLLDQYLDPQPDMDVGLKPDNLVGEQFARRYQFGHLGTGERVGFHFIATGDRNPDFGRPVLRSEKSDAQLVERGTLKIADDSKHIQPFLIKVMTFAALAALSFTFSFGSYPIRLIGLVLLPFQIGILILLLPDIAPVTRLFTELVKNSLTRSRTSSPAVSIEHVQVADSGRVVVAGTLDGGSSVNFRTPQDAPSDVGAGARAGEDGEGRTQASSE
jgi:hypothetical protein